MSDTLRCPSGHDPDTCANLIAERLSRGRTGSKRNRQCPHHDDDDASLSINPGRKGMWMVWCCGAGCSFEDVRADMLDLGIDPGCLGNYGLPKRGIVPGLRVASLDPALVADVKRLHAIQKLPGPDDLAGHLYRMCIQAIIEGDGDLQPDPIRLLPWTKGEFLALAARTGIQRGYRYRLFDQWSALLAKSEAA